MNRRRLLWAAAIVVLALLALAVAFESGWIPWPSGMKANADAVRLGMSEREVDAVLGARRRSRRPGPIQARARSCGRAGVRSGIRQRATSPSTLVAMGG
jgi:hypothetical protein